MCASINWSVQELPMFPTDCCGSVFRKDFGVEPISFRLFKVESVSEKGQAAGSSSILLPSSISGDFRALLMEQFDRILRFLSKLEVGVPNKEIVNHNRWYSL